MFCSNCGKELRETAKFCPDCGTPAPVKASEEVVRPAPEDIPAEAPVQEVTEAPLEEVTEVPDEAPVQEEVETPVQETVEAPVVIPPVAQVEEVPQKPKKKRGKTLLIIGIVAVVLAVALAVSAFASPFVGNLLAKTVMSPEKYLQYVQKKSTKDFAEELAAQVALLKNGYSLEPQAVHGNVTVTMGEGFKNLVIAEEPESEMLISWMESLGLDMDIAIENNKMGLDGKIQLNGTDLLEGKIAVDMEKGMAYLTLPELSGTAIGAPLSGELEYTMEERDEILETFTQITNVIPSEEVMARLICRYMEVITDELSGVSRSTEAVSAGGVEEKVTVLSAKISEKTILDIAEAVLEEMEEDKDVKNIILSLSGISELDVDGEELYKEFREGIRETLEDLDEEEPSSGTVMTLQVYVDSVGDIVGIGVKEPETKGKVSFLALEKGAKTGVALRGDVPGLTFGFEGASDLVGTKRSGEYEVTYNGIKLLSATIKDVDEDKWKAGLFDGTLTVSLSKEADMLLGFTDMEEILAGAKLEIISRQDSKTDGEVELALYKNDALFLSVKIGAKDIGKKPVTIPDSYVNAEDDEAMLTWLAGIEIEPATIIEKLRNAGMPETILSLLEQSIVTEMPAEEMEEVAGF